jgi:S1-C subfamily serine protease
MKKIILLFSMMLLNCATAFAVDKKIVDHLQNVSVTVETEKGSGSGVIKVRKRGEENIAFIFTAAHVIESLRKTKEVVDGRNGTKRIVIEFEDAKIIQVLVENGRTIGKVELYAKVLKYNAEEDLAVLMVRKKNFSDKSVEFYLDSDIPSIGSPVVHIGSFLGEKLGSASLSTGVISQLGRLIKGKVFDQTSAAAFPGSSGGGVYMESNGKLIGLLLRGADPTFNFICPVRRLVTWTKSTNIEWLTNDAIALPSEEALNKVVVEDHGKISLSILNFMQESTQVQSRFWKRPETK